MFVASHHASEPEAVSAKLPKLIGHIDTAIGLCTLWHPGGEAIQAKAGDPVCEGDRIETGADGLMTLSLLDGTRFVLSKGSRAILDGSLFGGEAGSQAGLRALQKGLIAPGAAQ